MIAYLQEINQREGLTILLIEHVMRAVMALAHKVIVLHHGEMIAQGSPEQVVVNPRCWNAISVRSYKKT